MKILLMIRHAKAEQNFGNDSDRKLTERGHLNAVAMAELLISKGYRIDKIFSSPSVRTKETAKYFAEVGHLREDDIKYFPRLYLGDTLAIEETVEWLKENIDTLAVIGHNPGVTNFTNDVTGSAIEDLPTSGIAVIKVEMDDWENFANAKKTLVEVLTPKSI